MDDRGHWHQSDDFGERFKAMERGEEVTELRRPVISIGIGEMCRIVKDDGTFICASFDAAEKNKVTMTPQWGEGVRPFFELAERVKLECADGQSISAQVWDNRNGKLILRTLPVGA